MRVVKGERSMTDWKTFKEEMPPRDAKWICILRHDGKTLSILENNSFSRMTYENSDCLWTPIEINAPSLPRKKRHYCLSNNKDWICFENTNEKLMVDTFRGAVQEVNFCPFCGWSKEKS